MARSLASDCLNIKRLGWVYSGFKLTRVVLVTFLFSVLRRADEVPDEALDTLVTAVVLQTVDQLGVKIQSSNPWYDKTRQSVAVQREGGIPVGNKILHPYQNP